MSEEKGKRGRKERQGREKIKKRRRRRIREIAGGDAYRNEKKGGYEKIIMFD